MRWMPLELMWNTGTYSLWKYLFLFCKFTFKSTWYKKKDRTKSKMYILSFYSMQSLKYVNKIFIKFLSANYSSVLTTETFQTIKNGDPHKSLIESSDHLLFPHYKLFQCFLFVPGDTHMLTRKCLVIKYPYLCLNAAKRVGFAGE